MQEREIICVSCPMGCRMTVTLSENEVVKVENNTCKRGETYAKQECISPMRMVTAVAPVKGSKTPISVKTEEPIPKDKIMAVMDEINSADFSTPIHIGDTLIEDVASTGVNVIATKTLL